MVEVEINKKYLKNKVQDLSSTLKSANKEKCTDDLTNVYNRRGIREIFYQLLEANALSDSGLYVIMIDMDNLKKINDILGHKQGDLVLKNFAKMCIRTLRPLDYFARIGGDEFVALIQTFEEAKLRIVWIDY